MYICDLHIHSRFSRATSKDCDAAHLDFWARRKGIALLGTGDFTHPAWRKELNEQLTLVDDGVYTLKEEFLLPNAMPGPAPRFVITGEISCIYKRFGKTRKVHNVILLPSLQAAEELSAKLEAVGNIHSDGRPILGMDSRDLMELTLETCPQAEFIPAHIWTPHFSMFGAFSDFNTIEECFGDMTPYIHAVETGLSSDPPMNWRVSQLDKLTLVSHSDAHSPQKLGREANILDTPLTYTGMVEAIRTRQGFWGTVEFFPEEGKYHLDGHRNCGVCLTPAQTAGLEGICPVCHRKLTIGVEHRVEQLADRPQGFRPENALPFESLAPLPEVIASCTGVSATSKKTQQLYEHMLKELGAEFFILRQAPIGDIEQAAGPCIAEGIRRLRQGKVERRAGFDGQYGVISLLTPSEIEQFSGQTSLFGVSTIASPKAKTGGKTLKSAPQPQAPATTDTPNPEQQEAIHAQERVVAVVAGPGTGKTKTLVSRIAYLIEEKGVRPEEITAVTFTNQAANEMRERLQKRLGSKRAASRMTIGTFHAICLQLLGDVRLVSPSQALDIAAAVLQQHQSKTSPRTLLQEVSRIKNGVTASAGELNESLYAAYCARLQALHLLDFDDLLAQALLVNCTGRKNFTHLLVDEFQDINQTQFELVRTWAQNAKSLFVIGDPDQSIYGFRGAGGDCFARLQQEFPDVRTIRLVQNYRSSPQVLQAALPVIAKNPGPVRTLLPNCPQNAPVRLVKAADDFAEGVFIAKEIARMTGGVDMLQAQAMGHTAQTRAFGEIAVLCRTHRQLELIEKCLRHDDIPCIVHGREDFLDSDDVRGVLSFLEHLLDAQNTAALATALRLIWDCPTDLILKMQREFAANPGFDIPVLQQSVKGFGHLQLWLKRVEEWLGLLNSQKPWQLIEHWQALYGRSDALEKLKNTAVFYKTLPELFNALTLGQEADLCRACNKGWESGAVRLMTLHGAKGLEFAAVFVAGAKETMLPLQNKGRPTDIQEERRLFYVGLTRAKEELIITYAHSPSAFLQDLPHSVKTETARPLREAPMEQLSLF